MSEVKEEPTPKPEGKSCIYCSVVHPALPEGYDPEKTENTCKCGCVMCPMCEGVCFCGEDDDYHCICGDCPDACAGCGTKHHCLGMDCGRYKGPCICDGKSECVCHFRRVLLKCNRDT